MRLCSVCGVSLIYKPPDGYCCPKGHGCWQTGIVSQPLQRDKIDGGAFQGGAIEYKGSKPGGKRNKKLKRKLFTKAYLEM